MSNDYDNYNYEDDSSNKSAVVRKRLIIIILVVIAIVALIFVLKGCVNSSGNGGNEDPVSTYDSELLQAGKQYYDNNTHKLPVSTGECSTVTLETLAALGLLNQNNYTNCNKETTYVQVCMLEDSSLQWTPWLTCTDYSSDAVYDAEKEGTINDVVKDSTLITKFMYKPQKINAESSNLGKVEEIWKDEIKYSNYKTLGTTTYYRYRDLEYIWNIKTKTYYTSTGNKSNASDVKEYYTSSPADGYTNKDSETSNAYKWFTSDSKKTYYTNANGVKAYSLTAPSGYPYNEGGKIVNYYRTRTVQSTYFPTLYYSCAKSSTSIGYINQTVPCGTGVNTAYKYQIKTFYACAKEEPLKEVASNTVCRVYSSWSAYSTKSCGSASDVCEVTPKTFYYWYKLEDSGNKKYYPSGSSTASGEKIYYTEAPVKGAQKDESTKATAYKWYKSGSGQTTTYHATAPQSGATKTSTSRWSSWSSWSTKQPDSLGSAGTRKIESRVKIKLQEIKGEVADSAWIDLSSEYVTLEEMINIFKKEKYEVNSLQDINNNGDIRYQVKMYIRNKKAGVN